MRQVGKIREYSEPDPVVGFLNKVRAELQRPADAEFCVVRFSPCELFAFLQCCGLLACCARLWLPFPISVIYPANAGGRSSKRPAETLVFINS